MKHTVTPMILFILCGFLLAGEEPASKGAQIIARLASAPLDWKLPSPGRDFQKTTLDSGVTAYTKADPSIPLVRLRCLIRAGAIFEKPYRPQVARLTARMIRESGSTVLPAESLESLLDLYAGELTITAGPDWVEVNGSIPSNHAGTLVQATAKLLSRPAFTEEKLAWCVKRIQTEERDAAEDPFYLCGRKFCQMVFGDHPWARLHDAEGMDRVTLDDVRRFFGDHYFPRNIQLILTGDFKEKTLLETWDREYTETPPNRDLPNPPVPEPRFTPGVYLVQKDIAQTSIYFGLQAATRDAPDLLPIQLLNHMVGGSSFASKFTQQVRDKEGLAYRVDSLFDTETLGRCAFIARCRTRPETTVRALDAMLWILDGFREGRITEPDFQSGRSGLRTGFVKRFGSARDVLGVFALADLLGLPGNFFETYQNRVQAITQAELQAAARHYLDPAHMTFVLVGNVRPLEDQLRKFGPIFYLEEAHPSR